MPFMHVPAILHFAFMVLFDRCVWHNVVVVIWYYVFVSTILRHCRNDGHNQYSGFGIIRLYGNLIGSTHCYVENSHIKP